MLLKYVYLALGTPKPPLPPGLDDAAADAVLLEQKKWSALLLKWHPLVSHIFLTDDIFCRYTCNIPSKGRGQDWSGRDRPRHDR